MNKNEPNYERYVLIGLVLTLFIFALVTFYWWKETDRLEDSAHALVDERVERGNAIYQEQCASCHGQQGEGGVGTALNDAQLLKNTLDEILFSVIRSGIPGKLMPAWSVDYGGSLTDEDIRDVVAYIRLWETSGLDTSELVSADEGAQLFEQYCAACHTIGQGPLIGPDLDGVVEKRDPTWLKDFITAPDQVIASGDSLALELQAQYNNIAMPNLGLPPAQIESLLTYLADPSAGGGLGEVEPLIGGDLSRGRALFIGGQRLQNGGPACIACHNVHDDSIGALGGGTLGPDLTHVYSRYQGDVGLSSAIRGLPFPTMRGSFDGKPLTPEEQADLFAYFRQTDTYIVQSGDPYSNWIWGIGALGALALFGIMLIFWPRQRKSISTTLRET